MKTPIGDILPFNNVPKYAIADGPVKLYAYKNGTLGLQLLKTLSPGQTIGYCDGWFTIGNNIYLLFYSNLSDYNLQTNPFYVSYSDYKKISFPTVPTWNKEGIDFGAVSTYVQQIIDRMNKESEEQSLTSVLSNSLKTGLFIVGIYLSLKLLTQPNGNN